MIKEVGQATYLLPDCERRKVMFFKCMYACMFLSHALDPKRIVVFLYEWCQPIQLCRESDIGYILTKEAKQIHSCFVLNN